MVDRFSFHLTGLEENTSITSLGLLGGQYAQVGAFLLSRKWLSIFRFQWLHKTADGNLFTLLGLDAGGVGNIPIHLYFTRDKLFPKLVIRLNHRRFWKR